MSTELDSKNAIAALGEQFKAVQLDSTLTVAEKALKNEHLIADMKSHSEIVKQAQQVREMFGDTGAAQEQHAESEQQGRKGGFVGTLGQQFVNSADYKSLNTKWNTHGKHHINASVVTKANEFNDGAYDPAQNVSNYGGTAGPFYYPQLVPGIVGINQLPLNVEDFLPSGTASVPVVSYIIESAWTNAADMVAEKTAKPQMITESFQRVNEPITKVAQIYKLTDEMIQDAEQVKSWLDNRLVYGINRKVQSQLLNGNGTLPQLKGILNRTGFQTVVGSGSLAGDSNAWFNALLDQMTAIRQVGFTEPSAIMVSPYDWATMQKQVDANGQYIIGGPFGRVYGNNAPNVSNIWGVPLVSTQDMPQGTALVANFTDAQVWNRQGITVEMTNSDGTDFVNDIVTVRAERRLGLALYRPLSFGKVTLTA